MIHTALQVGDIVWCRASESILKGMVGRFRITEISQDGIRAVLTDFPTSRPFQFNADGYMTSHQADVRHRIVSVIRDRKNVEVSWATR